MADDKIELEQLISELCDQLLEKMVEQQRAKVLRLAREAVPTIGPEDVLNPHDFPELKAHPTFEFEDGLLAGIIAAQIAIRAKLRQRVVSLSCEGPEAG